MISSIKKVLKTVFDALYMSLFFKIGLYIFEPKLSIKLSRMKVIKKLICLEF